MGLKNRLKSPQSFLLFNMASEIEFAAISNRNLIFCFLTRPPPTRANISTTCVDIFFRVSEDWFHRKQKWNVCANHQPLFWGQQKPRRSTNHKYRHQKFHCVQFLQAYVLFCLNYKIIWFAFTLNSKTSMHLKPCCQPFHCNDDHITLFLNPCTGNLLLCWV